MKMRRHGSFFFAAGKINGKIIFFCFFTVSKPAESNNEEISVSFKSALGSSGIFSLNHAAIFRIGSQTGE